MKSILAVNAVLGVQILTSISLFAVHASLYAAGSVDALIQDLKSSDTNVQSRAIVALASAGARAVEPLLTAAANDPTVRPDQSSLYTQALGKIGVPAVEPLSAALKDRNANKRRVAAIALGETVNVGAVRPLLDAIADPDNLGGGCANQAVAALAKIGTPAIEPIAALLRATPSIGSDQVRGLEARALGGMRNEQALDVLVSLFQGRDPDAGGQGLAEMGSMATDTLIHGLRNVDARIRVYAAQALRSVKDPRAIEPLIHALRYDSWVPVRNAAALTLAMYKDTRSVEPLISALKSTDLYLRDNVSSPFQDWEAAVEPLMDALADDDENIRSGAACALGQMRNPPIDRLTTTLKNKNATLRQMSAMALGVAKKREVVDLLIAALKDDIAAVRAESARSLGKIGDQRALAPLAELVADSETNVRIAAAYGLGETEGIRICEPLLGALRERRLEIVAGAYAYLIRRAEPASEAVLVAALDRFGTATMAEDFLNSGNDELAAGGKIWAREHGWLLAEFNSPTSKRMPGLLYPKWGSK